MLLSEIVHLNSQADDLHLRRVTVFGVPSPPHKVSVNGLWFPGFSYNLDTKVRAKFQSRLPLIAWWNTNEIKLNLECVSFSHSINLFFF